MGTTAGSRDGQLHRGRAEGSPRARQVVEVRLLVDDERALLSVRSTGGRGEHERELWAPAPTATHAANAVARHYGLVRTATDRWQAPDVAGASALRSTG